ncbi:MAG: 6,7-dimethyl-8-ribityllumazine synthase [Victivallales bacterium]|nr:6,7-dimethyl-8-ribityllumazine synthase [Victivallales bacterium]
MNNETQLLQGSMNGDGLKIGIVCARFNSIFVEQLLSGAQDALVRHGVNAKDITVAWVPGSFETPLVLQRMAATGKFDALIGLGVVIQGATQHAQMINSEVSKAYAQISLNYNLPVVYGVVTTENIEQAIERSGSKAGNRGASAAATAIEMANLLRQLPVKARK